MAGHFNQIYRSQCSSFILLSDTKNLLFSYKKKKEFIGRLACHADDFKCITGMFQAIFYVTTMDEQICEKQQDIYCRNSTTSSSTSST